MMAAIGAVPVCKVYYNKCYEKVGFLDFGCRGALNLRGLKKWECGGLRGFPETQRAVAPVEEDGKALVAPAAKTDEETEVITNSRGFHKDMNGLPRPLSSSEIYNSPINGSKVRIAYQGVPGAYSEAAALKAYPACEPVPCDQFEAVFKAVELWLVDKAIIPVENSVGGSVHRNYDLLLTHRLHIVGEVQMVVNHCLLGLPGVRLEDIKSVLSHPQALYQCEMSLKELGVTKLSTNDTAGAAQIIAAEGVRETGAIASAKAAEIYGLNVLAEGMQDYNDNITRFLILSREPIIPGTRRPYKTSIVFSLEEGPGVLFKALAVFALRDINMLKIESRPLRNRPLRIIDGSSSGMYFDYLFYLDFEASMAEPRAQCALGHLQEMAKFLRVLGSYPMCTTL